MSVALVPCGKLFTSKLALFFFSVFEDKSTQQICMEVTLQHLKIIQPVSQVILIAGFTVKLNA